MMVDSPVMKRRYRNLRIFKYTCASMLWLSIGALVVLIIHVVKEGVHWLDWEFLTSFPSRHAEKAGVKAALYGTVWMVGLSALISVPFGIAAALHMEEFAQKNRLSQLIEVNIANLAGVPSIVYGMLGLVVFVRALEMGRSVLAGSLTMSLLILPVIIIAAREAIRTVPGTLRQAAFALGATRWQTVWHHVLPAALPGILTGVILALSRAAGETAPLIMTGALTYVAFVPQGVGDAFTVLPMQIFNWASRPQHEFHGLAAAAILILLISIIAMNATAIFIRCKTTKIYHDC